MTMSTNLVPIIVVAGTMLRGTLANGAGPSALTSFVPLRARVSAKAYRTLTSTMNPGTSTQRKLSQTLRDRPCCRPCFPEAWFVQLSRNNRSKEVLIDHEIMVCYIARFMTDRAETVPSVRTSTLKVPEREGDGEQTKYQATEICRGWVARGPSVLTKAKLTARNESKWSSES